MNNFYYVYMLQSSVNKYRYYVGLTKDLTTRLKQHNSGKSKYTQSFKPWKIVTAIAFDSKIKAEAFEIYLKSHSGRAFSIKHF